jgi:hypothetical protein
MLTRIIVEAYAWIAEIYLWVMLVFGAVVGYQFALPLLSVFRYEPINEGAWRIFGAVTFMAGTFLLLAVVTGPFLILVEILKSVRSIEGRLKLDEPRIDSALERREPSL